MTRENDMVHTKLARQVGGAIACLLAAALLLGLTACGGGQAKGPEDEPPAVENTEPSPPEPDGPSAAQEPEIPQTPLPEEEDEHDGFPEPEEDDPLPPAVHDFTQEEYDQTVADTLDSIIEDGMTPMEQAKAVFTYVHNNIRYISHSDKSDWMNGAYAGLTTGKGDCFTYYAVSRALLTALEIDNLEVQRTGGKTQHFWNLVNCGDGWYHFDACPRSIKMPSFYSFMVTDEQIAAFTAMAGRNYYDFDGSLLPERATETVTNTRPIPRPPEETEETLEDVDPSITDPSLADPGADPGEPVLPPEEDDSQPALPADETGAPAENETGTENGEPPAEVWTEPPPEDMPEPGPAEDPDPDPVLDPAEPLPEDGGQEAA